jgi:outer membrane lipoprotein-sorting protein
VRHSVGSCSAIAALALLAGCRPPPKALQQQDLELPIRTASAEELVHELHGAATLIGLKGKLTLGFRKSARAELRTCRGVLAARSPWAGGESGLYVKGYRSLFPTLFTLVSDGRLFWLHVPRDNVVYTGPVARRRGAVGAREIPLDARDLFRALFVQPLGADEVLDVEEQPLDYVVSARRDGRLQRRLWLERRRFTIRHEVFYDASGREEVIIERERYVDAGGRPYPERMLLRDGASGGTVLLEFERVTLDPADLKADAFRPRLPPGARTQPIGGAGEGSSP